MKFLGFLFKAVLVVTVLAAVVLGGVWLSLRKSDIPYAELERRYATPASRYVELPNGVRMHYRDEGKADGPVLLLVHGFTASLNTWEPWVRQLGADYRIVSIDLPGHGLTRAPAGWKPSMEAYAGVLETFVQSQKLGRFTLVGQSMGGNVAWEYALARPERLEALVLVSAAGWPDPRAEKAKDDMAMRLLEQPWGRAALRDLDASRLMRKGLESAFEDDTLVTEAMVARYVDLNRAPGHRDVTVDLTLGFDERNFATPQRLAGLKVPTLILHGMDDELVPVEHGQKFADAIAGSKLAIYANTGHMLNEERAGQSAADLKAFLAGLKPVAPAPVPPRALTFKPVSPEKAKALTDSAEFFQ